MKAIVCEMCGSQDLVKKDGMYVCQNCGTKYDPEEAKKMMVEVDNSKKLSNLYARARKSLEVHDLAHTAEYYKQILDENPDDWEAYFYSYLGEFTTYTNAQAGSVADKLSKTIPPAYDMAIRGCGKSVALVRINTITIKTCKMVPIAATGIALLREQEGDMGLSPAGQVKFNLYNNLKPTAANTVGNCVLAFDALEKKIEEIIQSDSEISKDDCKESLLYLSRARYQIANVELHPLQGKTDRLINAEYVIQYAKKLNELDPSVEIPSEYEASSTTFGCYVATAVYGSYDCPQVWTLRRFRDYTLAETWYGRAFIRTYYAISPMLVKWFGHANWFKNLWKPRLDRLIERLNNDGVEDTPYSDRMW